MEQAGNFQRSFYSGRLLLGTLLLVCSSAICSPASSAQGNALLVPGNEQVRVPDGAGRTNFVLNEISSLSESAGEIYNLAFAGKMDRIPKKLDTLKKNASAFDYIKDERSSLLLPRLGRSIADLETALAARNRLETMRYANMITLIAATVAVPFKPCIPTEVSLLAYNSRELEIWSEVKKTDRLPNIAIRMHLAWQTLMPRLIEHDAVKELKRFSEIMGYLESARTPEEYGRLARQLLVQTEIMKAVFAKQAK